jgi:hypothetical protein
MPKHIKVTEIAAYLAVVNAISAAYLAESTILE